MSLEKELIYHEYLQREDEFVRAAYQPEFDFYIAVKNGDISKVKKLCQENFAEKEGLGILSKNPIQNLRYHFAITAAMLARYCIEGGLDLSDSYSLSDFYIQKVDAAKTPQEITELHNAMSLDYTKKMKHLRKKAIKSMPVAKAVDYIYDHLHTRITLKELADYVERDPAYLSRVFKKELGVSVSRYIRAKKIETARNMLVYSEFTPSEISSILAFPSQSYFSEVFKKEMGMTPTEYKNDNLFVSGIKQ